MIPICILLLAAMVSSHDTETTTSSPNVTTLYPINKTITRNDSEPKASKKPSLQTWRLEASFAASNITEVEDKNNTEVGEKKGKIDTDNEKMEEKVVNKAEKVNNKEEIKEFKPSQHLGSFFDEDSAEVIKTPIAGPVIKKPPSGFVSSVKDEYHPPIFNKIPKEFYQTHKEFPYKFDDNTFTRVKANWPDDSMDSRPTVEVPVKVPAGGLYKAPVSFKEKPTGSDEEFGLDINEEAKEHGLKKRGNPWHKLLRMVTAFIPVGLIISALTPSVITIHNVDDHRDPSQGIFRRSDGAVPNMAPISERCRRRLLCELQSDRHYTSPSSPPRRIKKHCYKIHCEDTEALWKMLRWLFTYNQPEDQRGRHIT